MRRLDQPPQSQPDLPCCASTTHFQVHDRPHLAPERAQLGRTEVPNGAPVEARDQVAHGQARRVGGGASVDLDDLVYPAFSLAKGEPRHGVLE